MVQYRGRLMPLIRVNDDEAQAGEVGVDIYNLIKYTRSNQNTNINQRPLVKNGDMIGANDVIADGASTDMGELALDGVEFALDLGHVHKARAEFADRHPGAGEFLPQLLEPEVREGGGAAEDQHGKKDREVSREFRVGQGTARPA